MSEPIVTCDNRRKTLSDNRDMRLHDLSRIAGRSISSLCSGNDSLLVFPEVIGAHGDDIGGRTVFTIEESTIITGNIMGFIGCGETRLKIGSRFDAGRNDYFMQYMLERVFAVNLFDLRYSSDRESVFDFLLFLFPYFLKKAMSQGVYREYRTFLRNDRRMRGALDVQRHIKLNFAPTGRIACRSREYTADNDIMQLVRHTIEYISRMPLGGALLRSDEQMRSFVGSVAEATPSFVPGKRMQVVNNNLRPCMHPLFSEYEPLRRICLRILRGDRIRYGVDREQVYGVLFDGSWLWEEYLNTVLRELGIGHPENRTGKGRVYMFKTPVSGERYPDFLGENIVLDAKYKICDSKRLADVSREDLAQIVSYMYICGRTQGGLIVPGGETAGQTTATLNGMGGELHLLNLPVSAASDYKTFAADMKRSEESLRNTVASLMSR